MSNAIIKSPNHTSARIKLAAPVDPVAPGAEPGPGTTEPTLESRLRAELAREYELRWQEAQEAARAQGFQAGYTEGIQTGHAEGIQAGKDTLKRQMSSLESILAKAEQDIASFWSKTESAATDLAFESVCQLLGEHALAPKVIAGSIKQVMRGLYDSDVLGVKLHPSERDVLQHALATSEPQELQMQVGRLADRLMADPQLEAGGCIVQTPRGDYCASLDVQLTRLRRALQDQRRRAGTYNDASGIACA